jgi:hypothetical protein
MAPGNVENDLIAIRFSSKIKEQNRSELWQRLEQLTLEQRQS